MTQLGLSHKSILGATKCFRLGENRCCCRNMSEGGAGCSNPVKIVGAGVCGFQLLKGENIHERSDPRNKKALKKNRTRGA